jgi:hypothetical protein
MGAGVAELCARAGRDVRVVVSRRRSVPAARDRVADSLHRLRRGRIGQADYDAALGRLSFTDDLTALADRALIFEAVPEDPATKTRVLAALGSVLGDCDHQDTVIATNTSFDSDREAGEGRRPPVTRRRHALLQPGEPNAARGGCRLDADRPAGSGRRTTRPTAAAADGRLGPARREGGPGVLRVRGGKC